MAAAFVTVAIWLMLFVAEVTSNCPCSSPELCKPITNTTRKEVFMFSLHDTKSHWGRFDWTKVTTVVMVGYVSPGLMCFAHQHGARAVIIGNYPTSNLTNPILRQEWVQHQLRTVLDNYLDGINIDYEDPIGQNQSELRDAYTSLVKETYNAFKMASNVLQVTVDVAWSPYCVDNRCYDYKSLSLVTDFLFVMSYDEQSQIMGECIARANSGYNKTVLGIEGYRETLNIPSSKLVLGMPWYGYYYKCLNLTVNTCQIPHVPFRGVNCSDAAGSQRDFSATTSLIKTRGITPQWDKGTMSPFFNYKDTSSGAMYQVWYDDPHSIRVKSQFALDVDLRGVGIWNADSIDYDDPSQIKDMYGALPDYPH